MRLEARSGIWTKPHNPYEGNAWCEDTNAPVDYRWAVSANERSGNAAVRRPSFMAQVDSDRPG